MADIAGFDGSYAEARSFAILRDSQDYVNGYGETVCGTTWLVDYSCAHCNKVEADFNVQEVANA